VKGAIAWCDRSIGPRAGRVQIMRSSRQARQQQDTDFTHGIHLERGKHEVARGGGGLEKEGETGARRSKLAST